MDQRRTSAPYHWVLERDGLLDVSRRDHTSSHFRFPYLLKQEADGAEVSLSKEAAAPAEGVGSPLLLEVDPPTEGSCTPYSESSQTVSEPLGFANRQDITCNEPYRAADGSVITFPSGEETGQNKGKVDSEILRFAEAALTSLKSTFPACKVTISELQDFIKQNQTPAEEFGEVMFWAANKSNWKWQEKLRNAPTLLFWYDQIRGQKIKFYATIRERTAAKDNTYVKKLAKSTTTVGLPDPVSANIDELPAKTDVSANSYFDSFDISDEELDD
jgi:hypothetical protein